jgi:hypothetical protein
MIHVCINYYGMVLKKFHNFKLNGSLTELCRNPLNYLVGQFFNYWEYRMKVIPETAHDL